MLIRAYFSEDIAHLSYTLIGKTQIFVIDPQRDIQIYLDESQNRNLPVTGILLTHPHADFISGHIELQKKTKAKVYAHKDAPYQTKIERISESDLLDFDHIKIEVLETPGHTPFCNSFVITDLSRGGKPVSVFTGDALFVGDVGRPDLFPNLKEELADLLYHSLFDKLLLLEDYVEVYPAHASGSLCGKNLSEKRSTTIGYERRYNKRLQVENKEEFINNILEDDLPVPEHFKYCASVNLKGAELVERLPETKKIDYKKFTRYHKEKKCNILDIRPHTEWINFHVPDSLSIDIDCLAFANYAGWLLSADKPILIVHSDLEQVDKAIKSLRKIGIDQQIYVLEQGVKTLVFNGFKFNQTQQFLPEYLVRKAKKLNNLIVLDVRSGVENNLCPDVEVLQIPASSIFHKQPFMDSDMTYVVVCEKGALATLVISYLEKLGHNNMAFLLGSGRALRNLQK